MSPGRVRRSNLSRDERRLRQPRPRRSASCSRRRAAATRTPSAAWSSLTARELHAHCYRMLGSVHDAEDALQEALLRAWRGLSGFEGRSSLRSWLYRIATNTSPERDREAAQAGASDRLRPGRPIPTTGPASRSSSRSGSSPTRTRRLGLEDGFAAPEARYEQREGVELAFIAALQHLPATQRAVLILREVLGFSAQEVAETLDTTTASVNSALQRARKAVDERAARAEPAGDAALARRRRRARGRGGLRGRVGPRRRRRGRRDADRGRHASRCRRLRAGIRVARS